MRLVEAAARVRGERPLHLLVLGDGPERGPVEEAVGRLGLEGRVHLVGHREDTAEDYRTMDVFCLSSDTEQMPVALLEAMAEGQVSVEGNTHRLAEPFLVIATQNPVEFRGTYPLPEAQMDRFALRLQLGYLDAETEVEMVAAQDQGHPLDDLESIASLQDILNLRQVARGVRVSDELRRYAIELIRATRTAPSVQLGAGPRASLALLHTARALALLDGLDYVRPDHVHELAVPVIAHRLVVESGARFGGLDSSSVVQDILDSTPMPQ